MKCIFLNTHFSVQSQVLSISVCFSSCHRSEEEMKRKENYSRNGNKTLMSEK